MLRFVVAKNQTLFMQMHDLQGPPPAQCEYLRLWFKKQRNPRHTHNTTKKKKHICAVRNNGWWLNAKLFILSDIYISNGHCGFVDKRLSVPNRSIYASKNVALNSNPFFLCEVLAWATKGCCRNSLCIASYCFLYSTQTHTSTFLRKYRGVGVGLSVSEESAAVSAWVWLTLSPTHSIK